LPKEFYLTVVVTLLVVNALIFFLAVQLILLHIYLISNDMTTYEYIVNSTHADGKTKEKTLGERVAGLVDGVVLTRCGKKKKTRRRNQQETDASPTSEAASAYDEDPNPTPPGSPSISPSIPSTGPKSASLDDIQLEFEDAGSHQKNHDGTRIMKELGIYNGITPGCAGCGII